ncbi:hypothetical protein AB395_0000183 [Sinorhizobium fredii CCBAU 45436]|nr:hypothetical protein SF83666_c01810 [Sinorhizobium fredii CCBAU 83666]AWI55867.1 hypothetical protein AB395_0000183 [Sinorhizobium fredii CCBAU 45436]
MSTAVHLIERGFPPVSKGEDVMRKSTAALAFGLGLGLALPAGAQQPAPGRFSMQKSETGFARLDTETGEVTLCREKNGELICRMAADERAAFERELDLLTKRVEALEKAVQGGATAVKPDLPTDEEIDRTMSIMERMMRKFMDIVKDLEGRDTTEQGGPVPDKT